MVRRHRRDYMQTTAIILCIVGLLACVLLVAALLLGSALGWWTT